MKNTTIYVTSALVLALTLSSARSTTLKEEHDRLAALMMISPGSLKANVPGAELVPGMRARPLHELKDVPVRNVDADCAIQGRSKDSCIAVAQDAYDVVKLYWGDVTPIGRQVCDSYAERRSSQLGAFTYYSVLQICVEQRIKAQQSLLQLEPQHFRP